VGAEGARARALLRLIHEETGSEFTAAELLQHCVPFNLALEDCIERCIVGRKRANRSKQRRARVMVNARTVGQFLQTIAGRRYRFLRLEAHYRSERWRYEVVSRRPLGKKAKAKLLAVPRIEVKPTRAGLKQLGKNIERSEEERRETAWNYECLIARAAQLRNDKTSEPKPVAAPEPIIEPTPAPVPLCRFSGAPMTGRYQDGRRQRCCGRIHD
jgi:hypothetical protein